jgi:hypothetical protein
MLMLAIALGLAGCGGEEGDRLTLTFVGFSGEGIDQADEVRDTSADVDICQGLCGDLAELDAEPFTQTSVTGAFLNNGTSDILLDRYTVNVPGSGVPEQTYSIARLLPAGEQTSVSFLLYDFTFKDLVVLGECPSISIVDGNIEFIPGTVITQTLPVEMTFSGEDDSGERFTIAADYQSTFDNFDACEE